MKPATPGGKNTETNGEHRPTEGYNLPEWDSFEKNALKGFKSML
jgi:hypothetical protein